jgi:hypothetical protein
MVASTNDKKSIQHSFFSSFCIREENVFCAKSPCIANRPSLWRTRISTLSRYDSTTRVHTQQILCLCTIKNNFWSFYSLSFFAEEVKRRRGRSRVVSRLGRQLQKDSSDCETTDFMPFLRGKYTAHVI